VRSKIDTTASSFANFFISTVARFFKNLNKVFFKVLEQYTYTDQIDSNIVRDWRSMKFSKNATATNASLSISREVKKPADSLT